MGRMADARKRAKSRGGQASAAVPSGTAAEGAAPAPPSQSDREQGGTTGLTPGVPEHRPSDPEPSADSAGWVAHDEPLVFPGDAPAAGATAKISLPSSGLAADILARADAARVETAPETAPVPVPGAPSAALAAVAESPRTHNVSFFASPMREERKVVESTEHLATFLLAGEEYGVDVRLVQEIIRVAEITPVPRAPEFIKGVINLRGRIIPVVDLKRKLSLGVVEVTRVARIVVVKMRDRLIGLLVDGASQVLKIPLSSIEAAPEEVVEIEAHYIRGVAKLPDRLIILMDLQRILAPELREGVDAGPL